jgi:hypothetical protein
VDETIKRDATAPSVDAASLQANSDTPMGGVFNGAFSVAWSGTDASSGIASCTTRSYSGPDTTTGTLTGGCIDNAGNSASGPDYTFGYDATGPVISAVLTRGGAPLPGPDSNGWFNAPFTIDWTADEAGVTCPAATHIDGVADETAGDTVTATCTDAAGNSSQGKFTYKYDQTAPTVDVHASSDANAKGWRNAPFTLTASGEDSLSAGVTCDDPASIGGAADETANGSKNLFCRDAAGNRASESFTYKYDQTAPTAAIALDRDPVNGWYKSEVTGITSFVTSPGAEETSAVACTADQPYSAPDAENASLSGSCVDDAGNASAADTVVFNYDGTAPTFLLTSRTARTGTDGTRDWNNGDVTVVWTCTDVTSGFDRTTDPVTMTDVVSDQVSAEGADQTATGQCTDVAGNSASLAETGINVDKTAPTIADQGIFSGTAGSNGWYTTAIAESFTANDARSGLADCTASFTKFSGPAEEGDAVAISSGSCSDNAGNTRASVDSPAYKIDLTDPTDVTFVGGGIADGGKYYFGFVPAAPTCTGDDTVSGFDHCAVGGYDTSVGAKTLTATAYDKAGRTATATHAYTVSSWTLRGFYAPVDMNGILNTVKGGSTVPLKFEIFAGSSELTDTAYVKSFTTARITCDPNATSDAVETLAATGGTSLRYDTTAGQFIQNWKTPTGVGNCYRATMTTQDGSSLTAAFKIK